MFWSPIICLERKESFFWPMWFLPKTNYVSVIKAYTLVIEEDGQKMIRYWSSWKQTSATSNDILLLFTPLDFRTFLRPWPAASAAFINDMTETKAKLFQVSVFFANRFPKGRLISKRNLSVFNSSIVLS